MQIVPFGNLKRHHERIRSELVKTVERVIASGWYILGPEVTAFEQALAASCGVTHAVGLGNGTEALQLSLVALGVGVGDEVITVANAGVPGTVAILQAGATPVYVDVDEHSYNMDPALLEAAITRRTKAIMPVHLFGRMADMGAILAIAARHGLPVIEDCAQATGATQGGYVAGSLGVCGCFSFYPTKNLGAIGDGGAVVTQDAALAEKLRRLRQYGWERKYYSSETGGINSRLDELQAALLSVKLQYLNEWNAQRRVWAEQYTAFLSDTGLVLPDDPDGEHVYHLYVVRSQQRDQLRSTLHERGIGSDIHYPVPVYAQPIYTQFGPKSSLSVTERLAREVISLPMYPELTLEEVATVTAALREALAELPQPSVIASERSR